MATLHGSLSSHTKTGESRVAKMNYLRNTSACGEHDERYAGFLPSRSHRTRKTPWQTAITLVCQFMLYGPRIYPTASPV